MGEPSFDASELNSVQWPVVGPSTDVFGNFSNNTVQCTIPVGCFLRYSVLLTVMYCVAYGVVLVVGIIGNVCAYIVVTRDKSLHSVYYKFMANLAIADLLVLLFCLPVTLLGNLFGLQQKCCKLKNIYLDSNVSIFFYPHPISFPTLPWVK
ncbi:g_PROTEIN_RECEP_F1_2 domain-containing protein [Caerostris darwini]|uniref:G_PROTEIN_RECEP_F1_2 domain-containing protein n=1 Tax=Caerostris darwini TaxID=1538125 RepID=A0AAV4S1D9_9ARAC|nr:g_PROTEIN_RECEP_F1_2 domain-containing protein [Caerostris darwini]